MRLTTPQEINLDPEKTTHTLEGIELEVDDPLLCGEPVFEIIDAETS